MFTINGYNFNIIADKVTLKGTTRAYKEKNRQLIKQRMAEIITGTEKTFGAKIDFDYTDGYPPTINDPDAADTLLNAARKIVGDGAGYPYLSMGGEDFSYFTNEIPGCFFMYVPFILLLRSLTWPLGRARSGRDGLGTI